MSKSQYPLNIFVPQRTYTQNWILNLPQAFYSKTWKLPLYLTECIIKDTDIIIRNLDVIILHLLLNPNQFKSVNSPLVDYPISVCSLYPTPSPLLKLMSPLGATSAYALASCLWPCLCSVSLSPQQGPGCVSEMKTWSFSSLVLRGDFRFLLHDSWLLLSTSKLFVCFCGTGIANRACVC